MTLTLKNLPRNRLLHDKKIADEKKENETEKKIRLILACVL